MIHLINDYYMTADIKNGCSYVVFKARERSSKGAKWDKARYYTTLAQAVSSTAEIALRDGIAAGDITTLHAAVEELRRVKDEIRAAVDSQKED